MTPLAACIPSIGLSPHLYGLANILVNDGVAVRIYVNQPDAHLETALLDPGVEIVETPGISIYEEWNRAARWAAALDSYLLLLNDDVIMLPGTAAALAEALDARPDYGLISVGELHPVIDPGAVRPTSHEAGTRRSFLAWFCIARPSMWQDVDDRYRIWYGDDDLIQKMTAAGHGVGALAGVGVTHHVSTTSARLPWVAKAAEEDGRLWAATRT